MTPIQDILHRILWDPHYGAAPFTIGYYDRREKRVVRISFERIRVESGNHFSFDIEDKYGNTRMIPFHRVREVWRDDALIWQRAGNE
jgi:uncharacterized protein (UPF0248 family)